MHHMLSIKPITNGSSGQLFCRTAVWHDHHVEKVPAVTFGLPFCGGVDGRNDGTANDDEANVACAATAPLCHTWLYLLVPLISIYNTMTLGTLMSRTCIGGQADPSHCRG